MFYELQFVYVDIDRYYLSDGACSYRWNELLSTLYKYILSTLFHKYTYIKPLKMSR